MPKVSVIIPCYNLGQYLDEAVDSVLAQTFSDFEIIIVNDGSTDPTTCQLLADYSRPKTRVIHTENRGVSAARNRGIEEASGEYILPLDADDLVLDTYFEKAVGILNQNPGVSLVYCGQKMFGDKDEILELPEYDVKKLLKKNSIHSSAFFRKSDWQKAGGYCEQMVYGWEDWEFWISLSQVNDNFVALREVLFYYRIRSDSRDQSMSYTKKIVMYALIVRRHWHHFFKSLVA